MPAAPTRSPVVPTPSGLAGRDLPASPIREVSTHPAGRDDVIALWFGESDLPTDPSIVEAAHRAALAGETFYAPNLGVPLLRRAILAYGRRVYARPLGDERITVTAGGMNALTIGLMTLLEPGDRVAVVEPVWPNITNVIRVLGGRPEPVELAPGADGWTLDLDRLLAVVATRPKAVFVNSPNNPTGWVMPADATAALLEACRREGVWLIADEVYHRVVFEGDRAPSVLDVAEPDDRLLVVNSFSKAWAMTGWRLGWLTAPGALGPKLEALNELTVSGAATTFVQHAGAVALERGEGIVRANQERCRVARDLVTGRLGRLPRVRLRPPAAGFYAFFGVDGVTDSVAFAKELLETVGVGLAPGVAFGPGGEGRLRLCFAARLATLEAALDRLEPALA